MKLYDFSYKTGLIFGELYSPKDDTCIEDYYLRQSVFLRSTGIRGIHYSRLSCNGQTLAEQTARKTAFGFATAYRYYNSGDYYFKTGETIRFVSFNDEFAPPSIQDSSFFYNLKDDNREIPEATGESAGVKETGLRGQMAARFPDRTGTLTGMSSFDYFANGQKIYTGISGSYRISGSDSLFYYDDSYSGKIFAIPKNTGLKNITGEQPDVFGDRFVESTVFGYTNGASLHKSNWLELSTGVTLIRTGVQALIFDSPFETATIDL